MTQSELLVREAKMSDLEGIFKVENQAFLEGDRYSIEKIKSQLTENGRKYFVAEFENKIVGYSAAALQSPSYALMGDVANVEDETGISFSEISMVGVLTSIGVLTNLKGKGIGQRLLDVRLNWLLKNKVEYVFAHSWPNGGFPKLGERNGFKKIESWDGGRIYSDGTKAVLFYKILK